MTAAPARAARPPLSAFLYVQNLLGIGHQRRAGALAGALVRAGFTVDLVSGGMAVPGLDTGGAQLCQLPPVRAGDHLFKTLLDADGRPVDDDWKAARRDRLLDLFDQARPDILLTELFPFGRRQMRFELLPLLDRARAACPRPRIVCSMRDILVTKPRADRNREIVETLRRYYDRVLVHGDPGVIGLDRTFPMHGAIADLVEYTGYVVTPFPGAAPAGGAADLDGDGDGEVIISAGGGAVGHDTMRAVFAMRDRLPLADRVWRFVAGRHMAPEVLAMMRAGASGRVRVDRDRPDLPALLRRACLSISQAGYNTVMELMQAGVPAVVIPFEGGIETEQRLRADLLAGRGRLQVVAESDLDAANLGRAMQAAIAAPRRAAEIDLEGGARTAAILRRLAGAP